MRPYHGYAGEPGTGKQSFLAHADDIERVSRRKGLLALLDAVMHGEFAIVSMRSPGEETGYNSPCVLREDVVEV